MTPTPQAIENAARAIYEVRNGRGCKPWGSQTKAHKEPYLLDAQAVLSALAAKGYVVAPREPTTQQMEAAGNAVAEYAKKMTQAGGDVDAMDYALRAVIYRAMIAAAEKSSCK